MNRDQAKSELKSVMMNHVGKVNSISMTSLFEAVYGEDLGKRDKINGTRRLRDRITELREEGMAICSDRAAGYWLAAAGSEIKAYTDRLTQEGLGKLRIAAAVQKISLPALLGQMTVDLKGGSDVKA